MFESRVGTTAVSRGNPEAAPERLQTARELPQSLYSHLPGGLFEGGRVPRGVGSGVTRAPRWGVPASGDTTGAGFSRPLKDAVLEPESSKTDGLSPSFA